LVAIHPFIESRVLDAALAGSEAEIRRLLADMPETDRIALAAACRLVNGTLFKLALAGK